MARVNQVKAARKAAKCGGCGKIIEVGESYSWTKNYRGPKQCRCTDCKFKRSDLTGSDKLGRCYDAEDEASEAIANWSADEGHESLSESLRSAAEAIREVASEYEEVAEEAPNTEELEERAGELECWADDIESIADGWEEFDEDSVRGEHREDEQSAAESALNDLNEQPTTAADREAFVEKFVNDALDGHVEIAKQEWFDNIVSEAEEAVNNCPV